MKHHETVVIRCDDIGARCRDVGTRCGDVCVWGSDVGDRAEVIRCDNIGARCGDVGARRGDVSDRAELPAISAIAELVQLRRCVTELLIMEI